jgi:hypothetical protein
MEIIATIALLIPIGVLGLIALAGALYLITLMFLDIRDAWRK